MVLFNGIELTDAGAVAAALATKAGLAFAGGAAARLGAAAAGFATEAWRAVRSPLINAFIRFVASPTRSAVFVAESNAVDKLPTLTPEAA